jgi:hypothetical protein
VIFFKILSKEKAMDENSWLVLNLGITIERFVILILWMFEMSHILKKQIERKGYTLGY